MPQVPAGNLRIDFLLAIGQAVPYGTALIFPQTLLVCIATSLLSIALRQKVLHKDLSKTLFPVEHDKTADENLDGAKSSIQSLNDAFDVVMRSIKDSPTEKLIKDSMNAWNAPSLKLWMTIVCSFLLGAVCVLLCELQKKWSSNTILAESIVLLIHLSVMWMVFRYTKSIFSRRAQTATPTSSEKGFDKAYGYDILVKHLAEQRIAKF